MFHLLTSQVTFRRQEHKCICEPETLAEITSVKPSQLKEKHFKLDTVDGQWTKFCRSVFHSVCDMHNTGGSTFDSLLFALRSHMTHWTPTKHDVVVYTTVEEAYSGSCDDVSKFLFKLKKDLKIGEEGYQKYVVVAGDQQTYAHMSNLKLKYPGHYDWVHAAPGDWHVLKNSAELIKSILLDGGFRCFCRKCGHKGDISQWQDIHTVIVALYEAQMKQAIYQYCKLKNVNMDNVTDTTIPDNFWTWIKTYNEKYTHDELSSFWAQMLIYLHAYVGFYFAVRSGNWFLRNSCLKVISELYFAYSRNKYEVLSMSAIANSYTYPIEVIHHFTHGQWTVSVKGRPFHNLALDEAHESIINRRLKSITTRPSHFRMVELADFMAYLDTMMSGFEEYVFKWNKSKQYEKNDVGARSKILFELISNVNLFSHDGTCKRPLKNVFVEGPPKLEESNITDLLSVTIKGRERMMSYVRQYVLNPPTELRQKRKRQKLRSFTKQRSSNAKLRTEANQTALLLASAYKRLVAAGPVYNRTYPFPLALCTPDGTMRACNKSVFRDALIKTFPDRPMFVPSCPLFSSTLPPILDLEIIVDFLFVLHQPPPPDVLTFLSFAKYLWKKVVTSLGVNRNARTVKIVVDKPSFLPSPRDLLHNKKSSKSGIMPAHECIIGDINTIPHCSDYQAMLANPKLKSQLVSYIMNKFQAYACSQHFVNVLLDYEGISSPVSISSGSVLQVPCLANRLGEADYSMWYHCVTSTSNHIVIIGSDTDIWVYGMALKEGGWLGDKVVYVEKTLNAEFVDICEIHNVIRSHPSLSRIPYPVNNVVALYILSGSDYVSSFFKTSKQVFLSAFVDSCSYICENGPLVEVDDCDNQGITGSVIIGLSTDAWFRLVCCVYLLKHKTLFHSEPIPSLHKSLTVEELNPEKTRLMKCLAYKDIRPLTTLTDWHVFTHRVCFHHSTGSKHHESLLVPSIGALKYHMLRSLYVLKVMYSCVSNARNINARDHLIEHGWRVVEEKLEIQWEEDSIMSSFTINKSCGCKGGCNGSTAGCKNCFRSCKPCSLKCKCKLSCKNPHNDGGTCPKCINNSSPTPPSNDSIIECVHLEDSDEEHNDGDYDSGTDDVELPVIESNHVSEAESDSDID